MKRLSILRGAVLAASLMGVGSWYRSLDAGRGPDDAVRSEADGAQVPGPAPTGSRPTHPLRVPASQNAELTLKSIWLRLNELENPAEIQALLEKLSHDGGSEALDLGQLLVRRWAELDPSGAAGWLQSLPEGPFRSGAVRQVCIAWANVDLKSAARWVQGLENVDDRERGMVDIGYEAARSDPVMALSLGAGLPATRERNELLVHAASQWGAVDAPAARAWAESVSDAVLRDELLATIAVAVAEADGGAAAELVASGVSPGSQQDRAAISVVQRWAVDDPQAVADWVLQFPETDVRDAAVRNLVQVWSEHDLDAAGQWVAALPDSPVRVVGMEAYESVLADSEDNVILPPDNPKPDDLNPVQANNP
jgi:hypothetical protein